MSNQTEPQFSYSISNNHLNVDQIMQKYQTERSKRIREDGLKQYIPSLPNHPTLKSYSEDPFIDPISPTPGYHIKDQSHVRILIVGAGFGGLLLAVKLLQAGIKLEDIIIVDSAGGFGGTWYWNRYPGLSCDIESYIYLPLLEEMGYMPKYKYSYGYEILKYVNLIADKYNLQGRGAFRVNFKKLVWDEKNKEWLGELTQVKAPDQPEEYLNIRSDFVFLSTGPLNEPKLPNMPGILDFKGHSFLTSRWDYKYTGGSQEDPSLIHLKDKKVGILGTGASAVQIVPHLAKWSKELFVFQRTPSAVDIRNQHPTDPQLWAQITAKKGWQQERCYNFNTFMMNLPVKPEVDMVNDGWTKTPTMTALTGCPPAKKTLEEITEFVKQLNALDVPRQERIRCRVNEIIKDKSTAESLKAWYPSWCKRPCFHDEYLPSFNLPHVKLVDTDGKGIERITEDGVVAEGIEYKVDVLIYSTGYYIRRDGPGTSAGISVLGREGKLISEKWQEEISTLHGVSTRGYPNLFFTGFHQIGFTPNFTFILDMLANHVSYIISEAIKKTEPNKKVTVEPTEEAVQKWTAEILARVGGLAGGANCTPNIFNGEGEIDKLSMQEKMKAARGAVWGEGIFSYKENLEAWRASGNLEGLELMFF